MNAPAWMLIVVGVVCCLIGLLWLIAPSLPWLGKLPGDIAIERERYRIYLPIATCLVLSVLASAVLWLLRNWQR